jgi:hypothetical protein
MSAFFAENICTRRSWTPELVDLSLKNKMNLHPCHALFSSDLKLQDVASHVSVFFVRNDKICVYMDFGVCGPVIKKKTPSLASNS